MSLYPVLEGKTEAQGGEVTCLRTCRHKWWGHSSKPRTACPTSSHPQLGLTLSLVQGFSSSALLTFATIPACESGGHPLHYGMSGSIPGFYPLNAKVAQSPSPEDQKCVQSLPNVPWGQNGPWLRPRSISSCPQAPNYGDCFFGSG